MTQTQMQFCHQYRELSICVLNFAGPPSRGLKSVKVGYYTVVGSESTVRVAFMCTMCCVLCAVELPQALLLCIGMTEQLGCCIC